MSKVKSIEQLVAAKIDVGPSNLNNLYVGAVGTVSSTGWSSARLSRYFYIDPPADGIQEFDFVADPPAGIAGDAMMPVAAVYAGYAEDWVKGVRVYAATNQQEDSLSLARLATTPLPSDQYFMSLKAQNKIIEKHVATFDDSFQPTGKICKWDPLPHAEMKKLRHDLIVTISGPDENHIRSCIESALTAGIIAALVAAFTTGGAAFPAAVAAATSALTGCLGAGYSVRFDDRSHWIYWCT